MRWPYRDKRIEWGEEKNRELMQDRQLSFQDVVVAVEDDTSILDLSAHPNRNAYPHQMLLVVNIRGYACVVPFVVDDEKVFLKTIYKSRKFTKAYLSNKSKV